jgi:hypothetical protein
MSINPNPNPTPPGIANPGSPEQILNTLDGLKKNANLDHKKSMTGYGILYAAITMPKFFALLISLILSVYATVVGIQGVITKDLNITAFIVSVSIVIFFVIMYIIWARSGKAHVESIKAIKDDRDEIDKGKDEYIHSLERELRSSERREMAWRTVATMYKFAFDYAKEQLPALKVPDITKTMEEIRNEI